MSSTRRAISGLGLLLALLMTLAPWPAAARPANGDPAAGAASKSPDYTLADRRTGCPRYVSGPGAQPVPELSAPHGEHCVPLSANIVFKTHSDGDACAVLDILEMPRPRGIDDYAVVVYSTIGLGTRWFYSPGDGSPIVGEGISYKVPKGIVAWSFGGGSNASGGCHPSVDITGIGGWGVTYKRLIRGHVYEEGTHDGVPDERVRSSCNGATTTDQDGYYEFLVDRGQTCTIKVEPKKGEEAFPKKRVIHVGRAFVYTANFQLRQPILYFKVREGLSVGIKTPGGHKLIKAGTNFTERVTLKNRSFNKEILVAPIYPEISGNVEGGALQPVGGYVQRKVSDLSVTDPSQFVLLHPRETKVFDAVFATVASNSLGYYAGVKRASAGTRGSIKFSEPVARIVQPGYKLKPLRPNQIEIAKGSLDPIQVHVDDSAPDQAPFNAYLATYDITKGILLGTWHVAYGMVHGLKDLGDVIGHGIASIPTGYINFMKFESELWQEVKDDPVQRALFMTAVGHAVLIAYKEAPFLLNKVTNFWGAINSAVAQHLDQVEHDIYVGDWEKGYTQLADDSTQVVGNVGTLFVNPVKLAAPLADTVMPRVGQLLTGLYDADRARYAGEAAELDQAASAAIEGEQTVQGAATALAQLSPGLAMTAELARNYFGISATQLADLLKFCEENKVLVTLRSRAQEAIDLVEQGIAYVKPAAIKLKTVTAEDIEYLGYPKEVITASGKKVSSIGQVMIVDPKYHTVGAFEAAMAEKGVEKGSALYAKLEARWRQRLLEFMDPDPGYIQQLTHAANNDHSLTLDWHWGENHVPPELQGTPETVGFRMLKDPDSGALLPQVNAGDGWKSITGDVDLVSITHADGSALSDEEYVDILKKLGASSLQTQHPATATWYRDVNNTSIFDPRDADFADKAKYMQANQCCVMQVGPDNFAAAVELRLDGSWFIDKNNYHLNYLEGYLMETR